MSNKRQQYTDEFRKEVVALCSLGDRSSAQVARDLGLSKSVVSRWVQLAQLESPVSPARRPAGAIDPRDEELARLRKENVRLRMEREILKKATAFFALENS